jgi:hypothetical protein
MTKIPLIPIIILGKDADTENLVCAVAELPEEPGVVGVMLADAIRHVGNAYCGTGDSLKKAQVIMEIWSVLQSEMSAPTAQATMITEHGQLYPESLTLGDPE